MKKRWEEPRILVQNFVADEYVAACWYFSGTGIVITQERPGTDGRKDSPQDWQGPKLGFTDDGWDFLTSGGDEDTTPSASGWYSTSDSHSFIHSGSPSPQKFGSGPWGNHYLKDRGIDNTMASPVYYYGGGPYAITSENCADYNVGPNAS